MSILLRDNQAPSALGNTALIVGISSSLLVSGIHFSTSLITVPLLYNLPADTSTQIFARLYQRNSHTAAPLAALSTVVFGVSACFSAGGRHGFTIALGHAAGLTFATFFWTRLIMMRVTRVLLETSDGVKLTDGVDQADVEHLLRRWKWLNMFKGCLTFAGALIGLVVLSTQAAAGA